MNTTVKCFLFLAVASAVYAQVGITDHEDGIVPEAIQEVAPMDFEEPTQEVELEQSAAETDVGKKTCSLGSVKGFSTYAWDPKGRYCYHAKFGDYVQQDWSRNKSKCNKSGFKSNVYIGRFSGDAHKYPNGDAKGCPGGKKRQVTVTVKEDKNAKETSAVVTEPSTCHYAMVITRAACPDDEQAHKKAKTTVAKAGPSTCKQMADATAQEVVDNVKNQQAMLDKIDKGANCPKRGQAAVNTMKGKLKAAENSSKDAAKKYNDALNVDVDFGKRKFNSLTEGNCATFFNSAAYTNAKKKVADAKKKKTEAEGKVTQAKKDLKAAEDAAKTDVRVCYCDTFKAHKKALADANKKVAASNTKAWKEAAHLKCVLAGKTMSACTVPPLPKVKATTVAAGVNSNACETAWGDNPQCSSNTELNVWQGRKMGASFEKSWQMAQQKKSDNNNWTGGCFLKSSIPAQRKHDYMLRVQWDPGSHTGYTMFGFNHVEKGEKPHYYPSLDYAAYCWRNVNMYVYEKGSGKGHMSGCPCGNMIRMTMKVDGTVTYEMSTGGWRLCYTSATKAKNVPYAIDAAIYNVGASVVFDLFKSQQPTNQNGNQKWTPAK